MDAAVAGVAMGLFANSGQICTAGTRVFVHRSRYEQVLEALGAAANSVRQGDPFNPETQMGALVSKKQLDRVAGYVKLGVQEGAKVVAGGDRRAGKGWFFRPTILTNVRNDMRVAQQEILGPVGALMPFDEVEEAVRLANATRYGSRRACGRATSMRRIPSRRGCAPAPCGSTAGAPDDRVNRSAGRCGRRSPALGHRSARAFSNSDRRPHPWDRRQCRGSWRGRWPAIARRTEAVRLARA